MGTVEGEGAKRAEDACPEERLIRKMFSSYYRSAHFEAPQIEKREFGFGGWEKKIEFRHIKAKSEAELRGRLVSEAPLYVSYSVAYYEFPDARPMVRKNWLSADLVFDLDAPQHTCGKFTCAECFEKVRQEAIRLIEDFLVPDFGFSRGEISVNFSGSRGYHLHIRSQSIQRLDREARREIADYICGVGVSFERFFWTEGKKLFGPTPSDGGYGGKFARAFMERLGDDEFCLSISRRLKSREEKDRLASSIMQGNWDSIGIAARERKLREKFEQMRLGMAGKIDANVTADISKLIRMPGSLHGGSGFAAVPVRSLEGFEPMRHAAVFLDGELRVKVAERVPALEVAGVRFGPLEQGECATLPMACAMYLLCKKAAVVA
ncbi:MAG: DNA primase catalytic subunit PriS [Candidatus Micrarchaeota archaeon]|nr:DNA primase catalytic subunit PriS [Candidatus Micrarchaeota archaeon]